MTERAQEPAETNRKIGAEIKDLEDDKQATFNAGSQQKWLINEADS